MHCGVLEDPRWEDCMGWWENPNALWDAGGPQCVFGETKGKSP